MNVLRFRQEALKMNDASANSFLGLPGENMSANISFISYSPGHMAACLALFDANCPEYFSPGERSDYESFLEANSTRQAAMWPGE